MIAKKRSANTRVEILYSLSVLLINIRVAFSYLSVSNNTFAAT